MKIELTEDEVLLLKRGLCEFELEIIRDYENHGYDTVAYVRERLNATNKLMERLNKSDANPEQS